MGHSELAQQLEGRPRQWDVAVSPALAVDVQQHARTVDVGGLEADALAESQSTGVDGDEAGPIERPGDGVGDPPDLAAAEDDWDLVLRHGSSRPKGGPLVPQGPLEEELEPHRAIVWVPRSTFLSTVR